MFIFNNLSTCEGYCSSSRTLTFTVLTPYKAAPHNHYQPHPAETAQHNICSNIRLVLLKMGIMMPETCWEIVKNKHLTVASCWFSLSLHELWRIWWNDELEVIIKGENIVRFIKCQRIRWLGHIERMQDTTIPKRCCTERCMQQDKEEDKKWDGWMTCPRTWERWE